MVSLLATIVLLALYGAALPSKLGIVFIEKKSIPKVLSLGVVTGVVWQITVTEG